MFVPPVVTEEAAGAAELLTVVLLFSVCAFADLTINPLQMSAKVINMALGQFMIQKFWLKLLEKAVS